MGNAVLPPATNKNDPTNVVPDVFHDIRLSMYKLDKGATFLPVDEDSDMPELCHDSEQICDMSELRADLGRMVSYYHVPSPL